MDINDVLEPGYDRRWGLLLLDAGAEVTARPGHVAAALKKIRGSPSIDLRSGICGLRTRFPSQRGSGFRLDPLRADRGLLVDGGEQSLHV